MKAQTTRIWFLFVALAVCEGCQQEQQQAEAPPPRTAVFVVDGDYPDLPTQEQIDGWYKRVQDEIGKIEFIREPVEPPIVYITDSTRKYCGTGAVGIYCAKDDIIALNYVHAKFEFTWNHEFIHYIRTHIGTQEGGVNCHQPEAIWQIQWPESVKHKPKHNPKPC